MTRTKRFLGGLSVGYLHTLVVVLVGLWLTPYLLRQLGQHDFGLWLLAAQVLAYLALLDLGVIALLPRETAFTAGRAGRETSPELAAMVGRHARLVLWQTPVVAAAGLLVWVLIPGEWAALRWPLLLVMLAFVVMFPLRLFQAVLQGLQDLSYAGGTQAIAWMAGTVATVAGVMAGLGLYSLAIGWIVNQGLSAALSWRRLRTRYPGALPARLPALSPGAVRHQLGRSVWISVSQVAQVLLNGTDIVVVGKLLGPEAVVPYVCTAKLVLLLANQPQLFMEMALPALSDLRASAPRQRLFDVTTSMTQMMLLGSGAIVAVVLVVNEPFVAWWVGAARFGGTGLTVVLLLAMLLRHWNATTVYTLFCFGNERRIALTSIADGAVGLAAMLALVPAFGLAGAAAASLFGTCLVSLPCNLRAVAREQGTSVVAMLTPLRAWSIRFACVAAAVMALAAFWRPQGVWSLGPVAAAVGAVYVAVMLPVLFAPPLGPMVAHQLRPLAEYVPGLSRRLAGVNPT